VTITPPADSVSPFQYVPVPNEHVPAVLAFLAERLSPPVATVAPAVSSSGTADAGEPDDGWTDEALLRFSSMGTKTSETVSRMLDVLSDEPGEDSALSTRELAKSLDLDYFVVKAVPTQVTRILGKHFAGLNSPYRGLWGTDDFVPSRSNEMYFAVTPERAAQWKRLRSSDAQAAK
jgi:hypothetical protein